jgi:transcriptional regulator with XRE-family HTH domain
VTPVAAEPVPSMGGLVRGFRRAHRLTQGAVAASLGVSRRQVVRWEGDEAVPTVAQLFALARLLRVSAYDLLPGSER